MTTSMTTLRRSALALALLAGAALADAPVLAADPYGAASTTGLPATGGAAAPVTSIAPRSPNTQVFTGPNGTDMQIGQHARGITPAPSPSVPVHRD